MASTRRTLPSPLPGAELARLKEQLAPQYGSEVWDSDGARVLVVRVPRDEPDLVNDLEQAVQYLAPADVAGTPNCLLVGNHKSHLVPAQLLQDLMASRVQFDHRQCAGLRPNIRPGQHRIYRAPDDPHRLPRMVVRVARPTVADLDDTDINALVKEIGPRARESPYAEVRVVYLVADKDDVRIEGDLFFQDLHGRWVEQEERRRLATAIEAKETAQRSAREADRQTLLAALEARRREVTVAAPLRRTQRADWEAEPPLRQGARDEMYAHLDALPEGRMATTPAPAGEALWARTAQQPRVARPAAEGTPGVLPAPTTQSPPPPPPPPPVPPTHLAVLQARLEALKFDVLMPAPIPGIELAAERAEGYPQRLIGFAPDRLDVATAQRILNAARDLDADMAVVVTSQADADAKRMFIATKARHIGPADIAAFEI